MTTKLTTKSISRPAVISVRGLTPFVLILLATLAVLAIAVFSQAPTGMTTADGFVAGETFATNGKLILGLRAAGPNSNLAPNREPVIGSRAGVGPASNLAPNRESVIGSRGGVGPAWHHGPRVSIAKPPVAEVGQPIFQASPQDNPELSIARRYTADGSYK